MSKCNQIKEGMAIIVIGKLNEIKKGTIKTVYEDLGYALVSFGNDVLEKVPFNEIGILPETEETEAVEAEQPEEPKEDSIEIKVTLKDEITITRNDFVEKCGALCSKRHFEQSPGVASICSDFVVELMRELFTEFSENE